MSIYNILYLCSVCPYDVKRGGTCGSGTGDISGRSNVCLYNQKRNIREVLDREYKFHCVHCGKDSKMLNAERIEERGTGKLIAVKGSCALCGSFVITLYEEKELEKKERLTRLDLVLYDIITNK